MKTNKQRLAECGADVVMEVINHDTTLAEVYDRESFINGFSMYDTWALLNALEYYATNGDSKAFVQSLGDDKPRMIVDLELVDLISKEVDRRTLYDEDGTYKANSLNQSNPLTNENLLELIQVVTLKMRDLCDNVDAWDLFYKSCQRIALNIFEKHRFTDFPFLNLTLWEVAEDYCEKVGKTMM